MLNKKIENELNEQISREFYSAYLYYSMSSYAKSLGFKGISHWLDIQSKEELEHGLKISEFIIEEDGEVNYQTIESPDATWTNFYNLFEDVLEHEKYITSNINHIMSVAEENNDYKTISLLEWLVNEQIEEERHSKHILQKFEFIKDDKAALLLLDRELSKRNH